MAVELLAQWKGEEFHKLCFNVQAALAGKGHGNSAKIVLKSIGNLIPLDTDGLQKLVCICCECIASDTINSEEIPSDSKVIHSLYKVLYHFCTQGNFECSITVLESCLPILRKMVPTMSDYDLKLMEKCHFLLCHLLARPKIQLTILNDDIIFKSPCGYEYQAMKAWDLTFRICLLVPVDLGNLIEALRTVVSKFWSEASNRVSLLKVYTMFFHKFKVFFSSFFEKFSNRNGLTDQSSETLFSTIISATIVLFTYSRDICDVKAARSCMTFFSFCVNIFFTLRPAYIKCWALAENIFNAFVISPTNIEECRQDINKLEASDSLWYLCCKFTTWTMQYTTDNEKNLFDSSTFLAMHDVTEALAKRITSSSCRLCKNKDSSKSHSDFLSAFSTLNASATAIMFELRSGKSYCKHLVKALEKSLEKRSKILEDAAVEKCLSTDYIASQFYKQLRGLGCIYWNAGCGEKAEKCFLPCLHYLIKDFQSEVSSKVCDLSMLVVHYENLKHNGKACATLLALMLICHDFKFESNSYLNRKWSSLQDKEGENAKTSEQCVHQELARIYPSFDTSNISVSSMLLWELKCYASYSISSSKPILQAWQAFKNRNPVHNMVFLEGAVCTAKALLSTKYSKSEVLNDLFQLDFTVVHKVTRGQQYFKALSLCAAFDQCHAIYLALQNAQENTDLVNSRPKFSTTAKCLKKVEKPEDVVNPNDSCSVAPACSSLSIEREQTITKLLDSSLDNWEKAYCCYEDLAFIEGVEYIFLEGENLIQTANIFTLFGHLHSAVKTWDICLKFAKKMGKDDLQLQAFCGLMNMVESSQFVKEADALASKISDNHPRRNYLLILYYTSRAFHALRTRSYEEGISFLLKIRKDPPSPSTLSCYVNAYLLCASYTLLPESSSSKISESEFCSYDSAVTIAESGLASAINEYHRVGEGLFLFTTNPCALVNVLLGTSLWLGQLFRHLKQPREARAYLKAELEVAQKLGLATRTAVFLCELAEVDLVCELKSEAEMKILDIATIVGDKSVEGSGSSKMETELIPKNLKPTLTEGETASPNLEKKVHIVYKMHSRQCQCYRCRNITTRFTWVLLHKLKARVLSLHHFLNDACRCYKSILKLYVEQANFDKQFETIAEYGTMFFKHQFLCAEVGLRIDFADLLNLHEEWKIAVIKNEEALSCIKKLNTDEIYLEAEAEEQRRCLAQANIDKILNSSQVNILRALTPVKKDCSRIVKTPTNTVLPNAPHGAGKRKPALLLSTPRSPTPVRTPLLTISSPNTETASFEENNLIQSGKLSRKAILEESKSQNSNVSKPLGRTTRLGPCKK